MRKERKYNYIYKTTCIVTNRYYIGMALFELVTLMEQIGDIYQP